MMDNSRRTHTRTRIRIFHESEERCVSAGSAAGLGACYSIAYRFTEIWFRIFAGGSGGWWSLLNTRLRNVKKTETGNMSIQNWFRVQQTRNKNNYTTKHTRIHTLHASALSFGSHTCSHVCCIFRPIGFAFGKCAGITRTPAPNVERAVFKRACIHHARLPTNTVQYLTTTHKPTAYVCTRPQKWVATHLSEFSCIFLCVAFATKSPPPPHTFPYISFFSAAPRGFYSINNSAPGMAA